MTRSRPLLMAASALLTLWLADAHPPLPQEVRFRHDRHADFRPDPHGLCVMDALAAQARHMIGPRANPAEVQIPARAMTAASTRRTLRWFRHDTPMVGIDVLVADPD